MAKSDITKKYQRLAILFHALSMIVLVAPLAYYIILGFINGETTEKLTLGITFVIAAILFIINILFKYHIRSTLWILVLGIYFCMDNILPLLFMVAIGTILDEFVLTPLYRSYRNKYTINREIDKRNG